MFTTKLNDSNYEIAKYDDSLWIKVFSFDQPTSQCFVNEKEAMHTNTQYKYSILSEINSRMKINNKFEFIIEYPNNIYFRWKQSNNPLRERNVIGKYPADGFEAIHNGTNAPEWGGLVRAISINGKKPNALLDGNPGVGSWWFSIGMYCDCESTYATDGMPGYTYHNVRSVKLWLLFSLSNKVYHSKCIIYHAQRTFVLSLILLSS